MRVTNKVLPLAMMAAALLITGEQAQAQFRKPQLGIYGGGTLPLGDLKDDTNTGWHAGGLLKARVTGSIDARLDVAYAKFGSKEFNLGTATVNSESNLLFGTLNAELNLGPDSAAYPGDNSISPYITAGPGVYRLDFEATCSGVCTGFNGDAESTMKVGVNIGAGANIPLRGFHTFAEVRYHRFSAEFPSTGEDGSASMLTASAGVKFR